MRGPAFGVECPLKIGLRIVGPIPFRRGLQRSGIGNRFLARLKIMLVIGCEPEFAAGLQRDCEIAHEWRLDKTPWPVTPLGPWIGEHDMRDGYAIRRQEILHCVAELKPQDANIVEAIAHRALPDFAHAPEQTLDGEEIDFRMLFRIRDGKAAIARTEIKFDRMVVAKQSAPIKARADILDDDGWGRKCALED